MSSTLTREQQLADLDARDSALNGHRSAAVESSRTELGTDTRGRRWSAFANGGGTWGLAYWDDKRAEWRMEQYGRTYPDFASAEARWHEAYDPQPENPEGPGDPIEDELLPPPLTAEPEAIEGLVDGVGYWKQRALDLEAWRMEVEGAAFEIEAFVSDVRLKTPKDGPEMVVVLSTAIERVAELAELMGKGRATVVFVPHVFQPRLPDPEADTPPAAEVHEYAECGEDTDQDHAVHRPAGHWLPDCADCKREAEDADAEVAEPGVRTTVVDGDSVVIATSVEPA